MDEVWIVDEIGEFVLSALGIEWLLEPATLEDMTKMRIAPALGAGLRMFETD